tara:strand:- start:103 stop:690 length:588 start_codon:yes stop_codon:yes gene_type:complete
MIKPFETEFPLNTFIGAWYINPLICDQLINYCEENPHAKREVSYSHEGVLHKKSTEWCVKSTDYHVPIKYYIDSLKLVLDNYAKRWEFAAKTARFGLLENFNIQHYGVGEGFYEWHFEKTYKHRYELFRHLVFMTYLNDVPDGGTEFYYQGISTPARKGLTLIWPSTWTHTHRGIISKTQEKKIITGWLSFEDRG